MYGLMLKSDEMAILDRAGLEYDYNDPESILTGNAGSELDVIFETKKDFERAKKLLGR